MESAANGKGISGGQKVARERYQHFKGTTELWVHYHCIHPVNLLLDIVTLDFNVEVKQRYLYFSLFKSHHKKCFSGKIRRTEVVICFDENDVISN